MKNSGTITDIYSFPTVSLSNPLGTHQDQPMQSQIDPDQTLATGNI